MFHYYIAYQHANGFGRCFIERQTPLDTEDAILEAHLSLERDLGFAVVILNWKRID